METAYLIASIKYIQVPSTNGMLIVSHAGIHNKIPPSWDGRHYNILIHTIKGESSFDIHHEMKQWLRDQSANPFFSKIESLAFP